MPTACWTTSRGAAAVALTAVFVLALMAVRGSAAPVQAPRPSTPTPAPASGPVVSVKNGLTRFELRDAHGARFVVEAQRDASVSPKALPDEVTVVGAVDGGATIILTDAYPSVSRGLHYCQAGHERFLRVFSLAREVPRETLRLKLESCLDGIELRSPGGLIWEPHAAMNTATLHIAWLQGPSVQGKPETLDLKMTIGPGADAGN